MNEKRESILVLCGTWLISYVYCLAGGIVLSACIGSPSSHEKTVDTFNRAIADGRITKEEAGEIAAALDEERGSTNWPYLVGSVLASLITCVTGIRVARSGTTEAIRGLHEDVDIAHARLDARELANPLEVVRRSRPKVRVPKH